MKITQCHVSESLKEFRAGFKQRYSLTDIVDKSQPVIVFGMYRPEDWAKLRTNGGIAVWTGSDSMPCHQPISLWIKVNHPRIKHIAISEYISKDLTEVGIKHTLVPLSPTIPTGFDVCPRGDDLYFYYSACSAEFYGMQLTEEIRKKTGLKIHRVAYGDMTRAEVIETYKKCFLGLRLTIHDGLPNTVVELALMGRKSIHKGCMPCAIPYKDNQPIWKIVMEEYERRHEPNEHIAQSIKDYLNVGEEWLEYPSYCH